MIVEPHFRVDGVPGGDPWMVDLILRPSGALPPRVAGSYVQRSCVENQLNFKMVKWIQAIEHPLGLQGEGGYHEDREYFGELADI